jgi:Ca2+-binding RTX toxin-like protein
LGTNTLNGGAGEDTIFADDGNETSKVSGGSGTDVVYARDFVKDTINCGAGTDYVVVDPDGLNVVRGCEWINNVEQ